MPGGATANQCAAAPENTCANDAQPVMCNLRVALPPALKGHQVMAGGNAPGNEANQSARP